MGLDQNIFEVVYEEVAYWRKHPAIHQWFCDKWLEIHDDKTADDFNCVDLRLTVDMIQELIEDIIDNKLNYDASGFFFGRSLQPSGEGFEQQKEQDLKYLNDTLRRLQNGKNCVYSSWW